MCILNTTANLDKNCAAALNLDNPQYSTAIRRSKCEEAGRGAFNRLRMDGVPDLVLRECDDIVDWLVDHPFKTLSDEVKALIVSKSKPRPDVLALKSAPATQKRGFNAAWYDKVEWLTGSIKRQKLFCWPCLLFGVRLDNIVWSKNGFDDLKNLPRCLERHSKAKEHISSYCKFKLFGRSIIPNKTDTTKRDAIISHNNQVRENRQCFKRLIDLIVFSAIHNSNQNINELLFLFGKYDVKFNNFITSSEIFSNEVHNGLLDSINAIVNAKIEDEINEATFFSWQVDETITSQLSIILRYIKNGQVVQRFLGFHDISSGQTIDHVFSCLLGFFEKYCFEHKLVAQSYGGAAIVSSQLDELQQKFKSVAPHALSIHSEAHDLNLILCKACNCNEECRIFFSKLNGFCSFFSKTEKIINILDSVCGSKVSMQLTICWNYISHATSALHANTATLIDVFTVIIESENFRNDLQLIREAGDLKTYLLDPQFCFILATFKLIFDETDAVSINICNLTSCSDPLKSLQTKLQHFKDEESFFNEIFNSLDLNSEKARKKIKICVPDLKDDYHQVFIEILNIIIEQIKIRFSDIDKLQFFKLLNIRNNIAGVPEILFQQLINQYPFFDVVTLRNELQVVYRDRIIFEQCETETPYSMLSYMHKNGLDVCMPQLYRLLCLVNTIPITPIPVEQNPSTLKRVCAYCCNRNRPSKLALLVIEKEFICLLSQNEGFYDEIIEHFAQMKDRHIPLLYKKL